MSTRKYPDCIVCMSCESDTYQDILNLMPWKKSLFNYKVKLTEQFTCTWNNQFFQFLNQSWSFQYTY